mgnify:CR=1 FL=1
MARNDVDVALGGMCKSGGLEQFRRDELHKGGGHVVQRHGENRYAAPVDPEFNALLREV